MLPRQHPTDQCLDLGGCRVDQALAPLRGWLNHRKNKVGTGHLSLRCNKNWREGGLASHLASSRPKATVAFSGDVGGLVLSRATNLPLTHPVDRARTPSSCVFVEGVGGWVFLRIGDPFYGVSPSFSLRSLRKGIRHVGDEPPNKGRPLRKKPCRANSLQPGFPNPQRKNEVQLDHSRTSSQSTTLTFGVSIFRNPSLPNLIGFPFPVPVKRPNTRTTKKKDRRPPPHFKVVDHVDPRLRSASLRAAPPDKRSDGSEPRFLTRNSWRTRSILRILRAPSESCGHGSKSKSYPPPNPH